ncbi:MULTISPECIES: hypothetical protein [Methylomicrobium]|uniref:hypothetical protein n=1 Tax=Methylomicrobium TaxID=39773 RepID=UPI00020D889C|nr:MULTISPECIES: hypothetical protein [Methylomicrobium]
MKGVLDAAAGEVIAASRAAEIDLCSRFEAVCVIDCSTVILSAELKVIWQGIGGPPGDSQAGMKIDTRLELKKGQLHLGYFNLKRMKEQDARGEYWISRLQPRTQVYNDKGEGIDLANFLQA